MADRSDSFTPAPPSGRAEDAARGASPREAGMRPTLTVIAGPEGAGKSTFIEQMRAHTKVPESMRPPVFSADRVQSDLLKEQSTRAYGAGNLIAQQQVREHIVTGRSAIYETAFSGRADVGLVKAAADQGYNVNLVHLQTNSANLSVARVQSRVAEGGRDAPEAAVRNDYERAGGLIREASQYANRTYVYDTSALNQEPKHVLSLERGQVIDQARQMPDWAKQTYGQELAQANVRQAQSEVQSAARVVGVADRIAGNDAAKTPAALSFQDVMRTAQSLQSGARVDVAGHKQGEYQGPVVAETKHHVLQQTGDKAFTAHFKDRLAVTPNAGLVYNREAGAALPREGAGKAQDVTLTYGPGRGKAAVTYHQPERGPVGSAQLKAEAQQFLSQNDAQNAGDPRFSAAHAASEKLANIAQEAGPRNEHVDKQVNSMIRQSMAQRIANDKPITINEQMVRTVQFQVAAKSLDSAVTDKMINPERSVNIDPKHRETLVNRSEQMIRAVEGRMATLHAPDKTAEQAKAIASSLARLDGPKRESPFQAKELASAYQSEQQKALSPLSLSAGKGVER